MDATLIIKAGVNGPNLDVIERNFDEQKFLQRITDLVVEAHERANNAELSVVKSQSSSRDLERRLRATSCRLESAVTQLYR